MTKCFPSHSTLISFWKNGASLNNMHLFAHIISYLLLWSYDWFLEDRNSPLKGIMFPSHVYKLDVHLSQHILAFAPWLWQIRAIVCFTSLTDTIQTHNYGFTPLNFHCTRPRQFGSSPRFFISFLGYGFPPLFLAHIVHCSSGEKKLSVDRWFGKKNKEKATIKSAAIFNGCTLIHKIELLREFLKLKPCLVYSLQCYMSHAQLKQQNESVTHSTHLWYVSHWHRITREPKLPHSRM